MLQWIRLSFLHCAMGLHRGLAFRGLDHIKSCSAKSQFSFAKNRDSLRALNLARLLHACRRTESPVFCVSQESADDSQSACESIGAENGKDGVSAL
jgi:hypothetical protein